MVGRKNMTAVLFVCFVAGTLPAQAATHEEIVESLSTKRRPSDRPCLHGRTPRHA